MPVRSWGSPPFVPLFAPEAGVKFSIEQKFDGSAAELCAALTDSDYLAMMGKLADLGAPKLVSQKRVKGTVTQQLRKQHRATFKMVPTHYQAYFRCAGNWNLVEADDGRTTTRIISGELKVSSPIPFVNGQVERAIVKGLKDRLGEEPKIYKIFRSGR
jgi:hypothetical protein